MKHRSQRTVLKLGLDKCFINCPFLLEDHKFGHSALSLELAFFIIFKTSICCLLRLQVVLQNDLPIFYQGQLSPKCVQVKSSQLYF